MFRGEPPRIPVAARRGLSPEASGDATSAPPTVDVPQVYLEGAAEEYVPMLLARAAIPYTRKSLDVDHTERVALLTEIASGDPVWDAAEALDELDRKSGG